MPAFLGNLSATEIFVVGIVAVLIFGKRLPEVASQTFGQLRRLRQGMDQFRRETGIDREVRAIEDTMGDLQRDVTIDPRPAPSAPAPIHRRADPVFPTPLRPLPAPDPPRDTAGEAPPATAGDAPPPAPGPAAPQESEPG